MQIILNEWFSKDVKALQRTFQGENKSQSQILIQEKQSRIHKLHIFDFSVSIINTLQMFHEFFSNFYNIQMMQKHSFF